MDFTPAQSPTFEDAELAIMSHHAHCSSLQDQNVLVPLHKLPAELLHLVFVHHREAVFEQGQSNFWWARGCTDVCSWWRRLILQSPQLWSTIKAERREDALKVLLERSRSSLLTVVWDDRFSSHIQVILAQLDRIKHLEMVIQSYSLKFFGEDANLKQAAMLKYLRVTWFGEDNKTIPHFVSQHCGGLDELIIRCESNFFRLAQFQPALQSLRCLELHDPPEHVRRVEPTSEPHIHLPHLEVFKLMNFSLQRALFLLKLVSSNRPVAVECELIAGPDDSLICEILPAAKRLMALSSWEDIRVVTYVSTQLFGRVPHGFCFHGSTPLSVSIIPVTHRRQVDAEHVLWKTNSQLLAPFTSFDVLFLRGSAATESLRLLQFFGITTLVLHHHTQVERLAQNLIVNADSSVPLPSLHRLHIAGVTTWNPETSLALFDVLWRRRTAGHILPELLFDRLSAKFWVDAHSGDLHPSPDVSLLAVFVGWPHETKIWEAQRRG